jgi:anaerobic ribonucleoside-triphosphate reductase
MPVMPVIETAENCPVHIFSSNPDYHRVIAGISYCPVCGYAMCPDCGSHNVEHLSRITGYVGNIKAFISAKRQKVTDRHSV